MFKVSWTQIKTLSISKKIPLQYLENDSAYDIWIVDNSVIFICDLPKSPSDTTDLDDFVNNYKPTCNLNIIDVDSKGRQITRTAYASPGWTYLAHSFEFQTSKFGSLYNKNFLNSDRGDCFIKFYDVDDVEVTDAQYEANITKTVVLFKPNHDYEMICGSIRQVEKPSTDVRMWVLGGIIELGGAYVKELITGANLNYIGSDEEFKTDGRASKYMTKVIQGVPYQGNQLQFIVRHNAGIQHKINILIEYYRA